jgi:hypothetical protein
MACNVDTTVVGIGGPVKVSACGRVCSVTHRCVVCYLQPLLFCCCSLGVHHTSCNCSRQWSISRSSTRTKIITHEHDVLQSLGDAGRRLTAAETRAKISEFQEEARTVMAWAKDEVIKWMLKAAARVGLKVGAGRWTSSTT